MAGAAGIIGSNQALEASGLGRLSILSARSVTNRKIPFDYGLAVRRAGNDWAAYFVFVLHAQPGILFVSNPRPVIEMIKKKSFAAIPPAAWSRFPFRITCQAGMACIMEPGLEELMKNSIAPSQQEILKALPTIFNDELISRAMESFSGGGSGSAVTGRGQGLASASAGGDFYQQFKRAFPSQSHIAASDEAKHRLIRDYELLEFLKTPKAQIEEKSIEVDTRYLGQRFTVLGVVKEAEIDSLLFSEDVPISMYIMHPKQVSPTNAMSEQALPLKLGSFSLLYWLVLDSAGTGGKLFVFPAIAKTTGEIRDDLKQAYNNGNARVLAKYLVGVYDIEGVRIYKPGSSPSSAPMPGPVLLPAGLPGIPGMTGAGGPARAGLLGLPGSPGGPGMLGLSPASTHRDTARKMLGGSAPLGTKSFAIDRYGPLTTRHHSGRKQVTFQLPPELIKKKGKSKKGPKARMSAMSFSMGALAIAQHAQQKHKSQ